jgi:hypothetical protein
MSDKKPLYEATVVTEFGNVTGDAKFWDESGSQGDLTWTPGWSQMRRDRDMALAEVANGKRDPKTVPMLPGQLVLARRTKPLSGQPDNSDTMHFGNDGFRMVTKDDLGKPWFCPDKQLPAGAQILPDGSISKGDTVYMWADGQAAAKRAALQQRRTQDLMASGPAALQNQSSKQPGSDGYVRVEK